MYQVLIEKTVVGDRSATKSEAYWKRSKGLEKYRSFSDFSKVLYSL